MPIQWYVAVQGKVYGPISPETLNQNALEGRLTPETPIRQGTSGAWKAAGEWEGLFPRPDDSAMRSPPGSPSHFSISQGTARRVSRSKAPPVAFFLVVGSAIALCAVIFVLAWFS